MGLFDRNLKQKWDEAIEYLDENYAFFLTHVLNIGKPEWNDAARTACVAVMKDDDADNFKFLFAPSFLEKLDVETAAFVAAHETMHILLNHLRLAKQFDDPQKFNIAADCVINDYLVKAGLKPFEGGMYGQEQVGMDCSNLTVSEVYDMLPDTPKHGDGKCDGNCQPGPSTGHAPNGTCTCPGQYQEMDNHDWMHDGTDEQADKLDDFYEQNKNEMPMEMDDKRDDEAGNQSGMKMAGSEKGNEDKFVKQYGVSFHWVQLLREVDPDIFKARGMTPPPLPSFRQHRRKLAAFPDTRLPIYEKDHRFDKLKNEVPSIVMALDTSGSIAQQDRRLFVSLAQTIPQERIKLHACTFTTEYMELDLENPRYNSGGTSFSAIEQYIKKIVEPQLGHYPKAVVVVTDGYASFDRGGPSEEHLDRWLWLLTDGGTLDYYGIAGKIAKERQKWLKDFTINN